MANSSSVITKIQIINSMGKIVCHLYPDNSTYFTKFEGISRDCISLRFIVSIQVQQENSNYQLDDQKFWYLILTFHICLQILHAFAQRGANWCFGEVVPVLILPLHRGQLFLQTPVLSRGTAVSISTLQGTLQLYAMTDAQEAGIISGIVF
ncbi:MAG: hypothetical protein IPI23_02035 [Bacteroidetes bacterium]|nr:hypothetical protein [Bacteroidota bacterium]